VNFACHPTASGAQNLEVSRDWCGVTVDAVQRELGGVALYINGAIGDVSPARAGDFAASASLGEAVAHAAVRAAALADARTTAITIEMRKIEIPMNVDRLARRVQQAVARAGFMLPGLARSGGLPLLAGAAHAAGRGDVAQVIAALQGIMERELVHRDLRTFVTTVCGHLSLGGDVEALAAPGEVLTRLALPLRGALGSRHRMIFGLTHDTLGYFVPEDEWMTGRNANYEESVSLGRHAGAVLAETLLALIPHRREVA
jgi:hypothetical protein